MSSSEIQSNTDVPPANVYNRCCTVCAWLCLILSTLLFLGCISVAIWIFENNYPVKFAVISFIVGAGGLYLTTFTSSILLICRKRLGGEDAISRTSSQASIEDCPTIEVFCHGPSQDASALPPVDESNHALLKPPQPEPVRKSPPPPYEEQSQQQHLSEDARKLLNTIYNAVYRAASSSDESGKPSIHQKRPASTKPVQPETSTAKFVNRQPDTAGSASFELQNASHSTSKRSPTPGFMIPASSSSQQIIASTTQAACRVAAASTYKTHHQRFASSTNDLSAGSHEKTTLSPQVSYSKAITDRKFEATSIQHLTSSPRVYHKDIRARSPAKTAQDVNWTSQLDARQPYPRTEASNTALLSFHSVNVGEKSFNQGLSSQTPSIYSENNQQPLRHQPPNCFARSYQNINTEPEKLNPGIPTRDNEDQHRTSPNYQTSKPASESIQNNSGPASVVYQGISSSQSRTPVDVPNPATLVTDCSTRTSPYWSPSKMTNQGHVNNSVSQLQGGYSRSPRLETGNSYLCRSSRLRSSTCPPTTMGGPTTTMGEPTTTEEGSSTVPSTTMGVHSTTTGDQVYSNSSQLEQCPESLRKAVESGQDLTPEEWILSWNLGLQRIKSEDTSRVIGVRI